MNENYSQDAGSISPSVPISWGASGGIFFTKNSKKRYKILMKLTNSIDAASTELHKACSSERFFFYFMGGRN